MRLSDADQHAAAHGALERRRQRSAQDGPTRFTMDAYLEALESSTLKESVKRTIRATVATVNPDGFTSVDRATIATETEVTEKTVTRHWQAARSQSLLDDRQRFNSTSVQVAAAPGSGHGFPSNWVTSTPLDGYFWNKAMTDWWESDEVPGLYERPWGEGFSPF